MRLFVAVWPPGDVLDRLAAIERPAELGGVRWTDRAQWHVTLRFLGEVADAVVPDAEAVVRDVAVGLPAATVDVDDRLSRFGREVVHVEVRGLRPWADAIGGAFDRAGIGVPSEERPFVGHITVARARRRNATAARSATRLAGVALPPGPSSWRATEVALVRSELGPGGPRYSDVTVVTVG